MVDRQIDLRFFAYPREFVVRQNDGTDVDWSAYTSLRLLFLLDAFRTLWGAPVRRSPIVGALGRRLGAYATTQHNVERYGEVRAIDCLPEGMNTRRDAERAVKIATKVGFTGIGIYPHWSPTPGLHLDVREDEQPLSPARWGGVLSDPDAEGKRVQVYTALERAIGAFPVSA